MKSLVHDLTKFSLAVFNGQSNRSSVQDSLNQAYNVRESGKQQGKSSEGY